MVAAAWIAMKLSEDHASPHMTARDLEDVACADWREVVRMEAAVLRALRWCVFTTSRPSSFDFADF